MRELLHDWWPVAAVTLFTLLLVLQIPRKAIFPPVPSENAVAPFASFVTLDEYLDYLAINGCFYCIVSQNPFECMVKLSADNNNTHQLPTCVTFSIKFTLCEKMISSDVFVFVLHISIHISVSNLLPKN